MTKNAEPKILGYPRPQVIAAVIEGLRMVKANPNHVRLTPGQRRHITNRSTQ